MYVSLKSCNITNRNIELITIEAFTYIGIPSVRITGLPDTVVRESFYRVNAILKFLNINLPNRKIIINISPAPIPKTGIGIDLAIITVLLVITERVPVKAVKKHLFLGELDLNAKLKYTPGTLASLELARKHNLKPVVPLENARDAVFNTKTVLINKIEELIKYLNTGVIPKTNNLVLDQSNLSTTIQNDFAEVEDQEQAVRTAVISAIGMHNILFIGAPGLGKTMIAERIPGILPPMNTKELIEVNYIYSLAQENKEIIRARPFRAPHHTASLSAVIGGSRIGEVSLAHKGILFLDELAEFDYRILNSLREPLEKKELSISRVNYKYTVPADFLLVATSNPCPCGYFLSKTKHCVCTSSDINNFRKKLNSPLLERFDIKIVMQEPIIKKGKKAKSTQELQALVIEARLLLKSKFNFSSRTNSLLRELKDKLSYRTYNKLLKLSKSISAMNLRTEIKEEDILEAKIYTINPYGIQ